ncbi:MAG: beta-xylosidase [Candidatus Acidiferrum sp.]|jgi:xylan 1,4-beta-xylosidase
MQLHPKLVIPTAHLKKLATKLAPIFMLLAVITPSAKSQQPPENVSIHVRADQSTGPMRPIWNYWGYDEPNYTYTPNGKKLLAEFAALSPVPVYIRVHNLFTTGDGSASLKWGSTNVYTEDAAGNPVYSWTILDCIFDTFHEAGVKPLVEIGFMPEALSTHPQPYRHTFPNGSIFTGWAYPPKDYKKWSELVFQFVHHLRDRYGDAEVKTWMWEVWNEPDIDYWKGTPEEFLKLYDFSADAVLRALPGARIGGPDSTGPGSAKAIAFLRSFLEHCARGQNAANGKIGAPLDFISFHPKGSPKWQGDHVQMGISQQLKAVDTGFKIVSSFPEWAHTPIILGESDPEGCAACSAKQNPQNSYRNGSLYASYTAEALYNIDALATIDRVNFLGAVNWSFEFEGQPYFAGFREMASNGLDKPVLNAFRMLGLLGNQRLQVTSSAALPTNSVVLDGVRAKPDVNAIASRRDNEVDVLVWNYHDDDLPSAASHIDLIIDGLQTNAKPALLEHFRIDAHHSNAFEAWKTMGSPEQPSEAQYQQLQDAGQLQLLSSPEWMSIERATVRLQFALPRQTLSLLRITW